MKKQLVFEYEGKEYTLEYTRATVKLMQQQGFRTEDLKDKQMVALPTLFAGAFLANHARVKPSVIDAIYEKLTNKQDLLSHLMEMYMEPIAALMDEPDEDDAGKIEWKASW